MVLRREFYWDKLLLQGHQERAAEAGPKPSLYQGVSGTDPRTAGH